MMKLILLSLIFTSVATIAAERNDVPSCYEQAKISQFRSKPSGRMLTVAVDQTTPLTQDLQRVAWAHIKRFIKPGDKLRLYSFSAYLDGHYTQLQYAGELEKPIDPNTLGDVPMMSARKLDQCLKSQPAVMFQRFGKAFANAMGQSSSDIPRSEILFSLKAVGDDIKNISDVNDNVLFIMSDMLEYSEFDSFYKDRGLRNITPAAEMAKVEKNNLIADFSGARVYVHGAAFVPTDAKHGYRSGKAIKNLESFWHSYFDKSNAKLEGFGTPELTTAVE